MPITSESNMHTQRPASARPDSIYESRELFVEGYNVKLREKNAFILEDTVVQLLNTVAQAEMAEHDCE